MLLYLPELNVFIGLVGWTLGSPGLTCCTCILSGCGAHPKVMQQVACMGMCSRTRCYATAASRPGLPQAVLAPLSAGSSSQRAVQMVVGKQDTRVTESVASAFASDALRSCRYSVRHLVCMQLALSAPFTSSRHSEDCCSATLQTRGLQSQCHASPVPCFCNNQKLHVYGI